MQVKPKLVAASKALANAANKFKEFQQKHEDGGRVVFTKSLYYYLSGLKFDSGKFLVDLDEDI